MLAAEVNYLAHLTIAGWVTESYVDAMPAPPSNRLVTLAGWKLNEITDNFHVRDSSVFGEFHDVKRAVKQHGINPFPKSPDSLQIRQGEHRDQVENEQVVHTQRFFYQIAGQEFQRRFGSEPEVNEQVEKQGNDNPERA